MQPLFPNFKPIDLNDKKDIHSFLEQYQPETSELTFTNLFIWRNYYGIQWSRYQDWLLFLYTAHAEVIYALPPIGPSPRVEVSWMLLNWLRKEKGNKQPYIDRADIRLVTDLKEQSEFIIQPTREQFDYIYLTEDLIKLSGDKYHKKKNHINKFKNSYSFTYSPLQENHIAQCLNLADSWCIARHCVEDFGLAGEWDAVKDIVQYFPELQPRLQGAVILLDNKVAAFSFGELLNQQTAVIHIEKTNPEIPELYAVINQQFCEHTW